MKTFAKSINFISALVIFLLALAMLPTTYIVTAYLLAQDWHGVRVPLTRAAVAVWQDYVQLAKDLREPAFFKI